mgnify:FL=1
MEAVLFAIIVAQIALILALIDFTVKYGVLLISKGLDVPFVPTPVAHFPIIAKALMIRPGDVVYDLGCGDGRMLTHLAERFPDARFIGIERNFLLYAQAQLRKRLSQSQNLTFRRENFYESDFSDATRVYGYLLSKINDKLFPPGQYPGVRFVSRAFTLSHHTPVATVELSKKRGLHSEHLLHIYEI